MPPMSMVSTKASLQNDRASFQEFFLQFNEPTRAVLEAGRTWGIIYDLLRILE
jgi:hypothetical protein